MLIEDTAENGGAATEEAVTGSRRRALWRKKMRLKAYRHLMPKIKSEIAVFLGDENKDRFLLKNPDIHRFRKLPVHYVVCDEKGKICAYGEAVCLSDENRLDAEICCLPCEKQGAAAGRVLLEGLKTLAEMRSLSIAIPSGNSEDRLLLDAGFRKEKADYMLVYDESAQKASETEGNSTAGNPDKCGEAETMLREEKAFFLKEEQGKESCVYGIKRQADKSVSAISSCTVLEYASSVCIINVLTEKPFRRKGYAAALLRRVIQIYSDKNIMLHVAGENENAVSLYRKLGFSVRESVFTYLYKR